MPSFYYVKFIIVSALLIFGGLSFTRATLDTMKNNKRYEDLNSEVMALEHERFGLERELEYQVSEAFIEKEAREKLNMVKPGEKVYVLDPEFERSLNSNENRGTPGVKGANSIDNEDTPVGEGFVHNLKLWLELF